MTTLVTSPQGLNDLFSGLALTINYFKENNFNIEDIGIYTSKYQNLDLYFDFLKIKFFHKKPENCKIFSQIRGRFTNLNLNNGNHLSNFVKIKKNILKEVEPFSKPIGFHFRFMAHEKNNKDLMEKQKQEYIEGFLNRYEKNKEYVVISDSNLLNDFFPKYKNVFYVPKNELFSSRKGRRKYLKETVIDLALLSLCETIYKTRGNFTSLAYALSNKNPRPNIFNLK